MILYLRFKLTVRRWHSQYFFILGFTLFVATGNLLAANVNLAWNASTAAKLGGYNLYYGQSSRIYTASVDVGNNTSYTLPGLQLGATYYFAVSVYDTTRNFESRYSQEITKTVPTGLVAAYGFEEANGMYADDASGTGNHGIFSSGSIIRTTNGYFGNALKFDGVNNWITVKDSSSLALSTGMTLEAWVYPTLWMSGLDTVVVKQLPSTGSVTYNEAYLLAANNNTNQPMSAVWSNSEVTVSGNTQIPPNQWTHLATTYDGQYQSLYVNGVLVNMLPQTAPISASTGVLQIGGSSLLGNYFQGYIDEVRIYNRALSNAEIVSDSTTAISVSNPLKFMVGDPNIESSVNSTPAGTAQALKIKPNYPQTLTNINIYLDASSTATKLQVAIYTNTTDGHPRALWATGALTTLKASAWNSVSINPVSLSSGSYYTQTYWIVILGTGGTLALRVQPGTTTNLIETSASTTLTALPNSWTTGSVSTGGSESVYGAGY